jgi:hypothetical protein
VPALLYLALWSTSVLGATSFVDLLCLYGYSMAVYVPAAALLLIQVKMQKLGAFYVVFRPVVTLSQTQNLSKIIIAENVFQMIPRMRLRRKHLMYSTK